MSIQPWGQGTQQHGASAMRASTADRERTVDVLKAGFAEGRLGKDEYEQRMSRAYKALTYAELNLLVADLPQGPSTAPAPPRRDLAPTLVDAPAPVPGTFLPAPPPLTNDNAVRALVCGILTGTVLVTAIPAVILGHKAKAEIRLTGERGDGMATAGIVVGYVGIAAMVFFILLIVASASGN